MVSIPAASATATFRTSGNGLADRGAFAMMTSLVFRSGFRVAVNDDLIPRPKAAFTPTYFQAMFVQSTLFGAVGHRSGWKTPATQAES